MKRYFIIIITCITLIACNNKKAEITDVPKKAEESKTEQDVFKNTDIKRDKLKRVGYFEGVLHCPDCGDVRTILALYHNKADANHPNFYEILEIYPDKKNSPVIHNGLFNYERGYGDDNDATIIILNYEKTQDEQRYFMCYSKDNTILYELDSNREIIKNSVLQEKKEGKHSHRFK